MCVCMYVCMSGVGRVIQISNYKGGYFTGKSSRRSGAVSTMAYLRSIQVDRRSRPTVSLVKLFFFFAIIQYVFYIK